MSSPVMIPNGTEDAELGQKIANAVVSAYLLLNLKSAKPVVRSNGVPEWTILAGLVAIEGSTIVPLTLATGMKTMPDEVREYSSGLIVYDLHAEILCLRMFNWWLMKEVGARRQEEIHGGLSLDHGRKKRRILSGVMTKSGEVKVNSGEIKVNSDEVLVKSDEVLSKSDEVIPKSDDLRLFKPSKDSVDLDKKTNGSNESARSIGTNRINGTSGIYGTDGTTCINRAVRPKESDNIQSQTTTVRHPHPQSSLRYPLLHMVTGNNKFSLRPGIKLALYISDPPCGDASMSNIATGDMPWKDPNDGILRGRANFNTVGVVRTKPGRADSKPSYSKSCSDKLCLKQFTGVLNAISSTCIEPIYLLYLVIPENKFHAGDFRRCFHDRLGLFDSDLGFHQLQCLPFAKDEFPFRKQHERSQPLNLCVVHCELDQTSQVLQNGVKNGAFIKNKAPKRNGASLICRRNLWQQSKDLIGPYDTYQDIKDTNYRRNELKFRVRELMGLWPKSSHEVLYKW